MQIVLNHVTRMITQSRICVAGLDPRSLRHVRPITPPDDLITRKLLRENGGPFGPGAVVELGPVRPSPSPPETEDHRFATANARRVEDLNDDAYLDLLDRASDPSIEAAFGEDLLEVRPGKLAMPAGRGGRSLAVVRPHFPELQIRFDNLYLHFDHPDIPARLRVTDVRFYEPDHRTVRRDIVNDVNSRLVDGETMYAMVGLARAMYDEGSGQDLHWVQVNGLCLGDRAVSDAP